MKENYSAWQINTEDFYNEKSLTGQLGFLVKFAALAPSGHNTQPWKFIINENTIFILPEESRALTKSDPSDRQLYVSLGCALENLLIAADFYNFDTGVSYLPEEKKAAAVKVTFNSREDKSISENHLIRSIPERHTNRSRYEQRIPESRFTDLIKSLETPEIRIDLIKEPDEREKIAELSSLAMIDTMDNANFRKELSTYVKSNITRSKVGMPCFTQGIPTPVSFFASRVIRRLNMSRFSKKDDEALLKKHTPLFCILSSKNDDKKTWLKVGQLFEHINLEAERHNLKTAALASAIQNEIYNQAVKKLLGTDFRPQALLRIGYCTKAVRPTPRLTHLDIIHY